MKFARKPRTEVNRSSATESEDRRLEREIRILQGFSYNIRMSRVNQKGSILLAVLFFSSIVLAVFAAFHSQVADSLKLRLTEPTEYPAEGIDRIRA